MIKVSNEAHCIKVATDFLTVEGLSECAGLAIEFREENLHEVWKDDVLQLQHQLFHAWMSLQRSMETHRTPFNIPSEQKGEVEVSTSVPNDTPAVKSLKKRNIPSLRCELCPSPRTLYFNHGLKSHM